MAGPMPITIVTRGTSRKQRSTLSEKAVRTARVPIDRSTAGCLNCRVRRKKCRPPTGTGRSLACATCLKFNIECWRDCPIRPDWMRWNKKRLQEFKEYHKRWIADPTTRRGVSPLSMQPWREPPSETPIPPTGTVSLSPIDLFPPSHRDSSPPLDHSSVTPSRSSPSPPADTPASPEPRSTSSSPPLIHVEITNSHSYSIAHWRDLAGDYHTPSPSRVHEEPSSHVAQYESYQPYASASPSLRASEEHTSSDESHSVQPSPISLHQNLEYSLEEEPTSSHHIAVGHDDHLQSPISTQLPLPSRSGSYPTTQYSYSFASPYVGFSTDEEHIMGSGKEFSDGANPDVRDTSYYQNYSLRRPSYTTRSSPPYYPPLTREYVDENTDGDAVSYNVYSSYGSSFPFH